MASSFAGTAENRCYSPQPVLHANWCRLQRIAKIGQRLRAELVHSRSNHWLHDWFSRLRVEHEKGPILLRTYLITVHALSPMVLTDGTFDALDVKVRPNPFSRHRVNRARLMEALNAPFNRRRDRDQAPIGLMIDPLPIRSCSCGHSRIGARIADGGSSASIQWTSSRGVITSAICLSPMLKHARPAPVVRKEPPILVDT